MARKLAVMTDFDGTLVRIAPHPDQVELTTRVAGLLQRLAVLPNVWVVVISGRSLTDLSRFLESPDLHLLGSHGYEMPLPVHVSPLLDRARTVCEGGKSDLDRLLEAYPGAWFEPKPSGGSVHFRQVEPGRHPVLRDLIAAWHVADPGRVQFLALRPTQAGVEVRPRIDWGKGKAARWWLETAGPAEARGSLVLAAGDDDSDEDLFREFADEGLSVRVGGDPKRTFAKAWVERPEELWECFEQVEEIRNKKRKPRQKSSG